MVKTTHFQCRGYRFNLRSGNQDPIYCMEQPKKKKKRKLEIEKELPEQRFGKDLEMERAWFEEQGGRQCV